ncbi:MAG TPA: efflux transporter outer membrane subunit [Novosphingobium sp.]
MRPRPVLALGLVAVLGGCSLQPHYVRPASPVPPAWPTGDAYLRQSEQDLPAYTWRGVFGDPRLQTVIDQALSHNQDIAAAVANIGLARAQYQVQRAQLLPAVGTTAGASEGDNGKGETTTLSANAGVTGYEVDLFGRLASLNAAARDRYLSSVSAARATRLTLVAEVASAWLACAADRSLLELAQQTADAARESLRLTQMRYNGGVAPKSDMRQAEIVLHTAEADIANQTTQVAQDINALRLLVGADVAPDNLPASIADATGRIAAVPAGLSSDILLRRPDVVEAEWQLRAANAQIGAARAALFPKISLTGLAGFASTALSALFSGGSFVWQAGGSASYPLFNGGAGRANVRASEAQRDLALAGYRKAIQSAFADVANVLARRGTIDRQLAAAEATRAAAADNLALSDLRYRGGVGTYLQDLTARLSSYSAERALVQTRYTEAASRVGLYRALGGDGSLE